MKYYGFKSVAKFPRSNNKRLGFAVGGIAQAITQLFANNEQGFAFDFNDLSTMYQDSVGTVPVTGVGQPVGKVLDKSGRGNHATQSTSAKRPILQQNAITGAYYLAFDGVDDFLVTGNVDFSGGDKVSLFTGLRKLSDSKSYAMVCEFGQASSTVIAGSFNIQSPNVGATYASESRGSSVRVTNATTASYAAPHSAVLSAFMQTTNTNMLRVNKTQFSNSNSQGGGNYSNSPLYLGMRRDGTLNFNGHLYSLIGISRLATPTEITNTENAIAKNVGVTL
ncbi:hypothetical protein HG532_00805 [Moraxella osloensis]|nr:hypothetical protein [Moraxella osloensis]MBW4008570.1 hypothetical protein [Moraxella osloensis]